MAERRCPQCWKPRPADEFVSGRPGAMCVGCRRFYGAGGRRTPEERRARLGGARTALPRVLVVERSGNRKLGGIPATISSAETCPDACALKGDGCFAEFHVLSTHWRRAATTGQRWLDFLDWVCALPAGQLWRHNEAGDLPGRGDRLDTSALTELVAYARESRGFTYTAKPLTTSAERAAVATANRSGFTINLSSNSPAHADERAALGVGPVATIVPPGTRTGDRTPGGRRIVVCPAQTEAGLTCAECRLCSVADRIGVVGFYPHGQMANQVVRRLTVIQPDKRTDTGETLGERAMTESEAQVDLPFRDLDDDFDDAADPGEGIGDAANSPAPKSEPKAKKPKPDKKPEADEEEKKPDDEEPKAAE